MRFADRADAGRRLAHALLSYRDRDPIVLALPRGGLPVAAEIATALAAPLDVVLVRKIGAPWQPELAMGALVEGEPGRSSRATKRSSVPPGSTSGRSRRRRNARALRSKTRGGGFVGDRPRVAIVGRAVLLVDDGVATGATALAALQSIRRRGAKTLTLAVPVASAEALAALKHEVDDLCVSLEAPARFDAVGAFYVDFSQVLDEEAVAVLARFSPAAR